jgi:hypothetical protein
MKMARVPLMFGPGHGRTFTMDLDALKITRQFIFCENTGVQYIKEDAEPDEILLLQKAAYHLYERQIWQGLGVDAKDFVILTHSENCRCQRLADKGAIFDEDHG